MGIEIEEKNYIDYIYIKNVKIEQLREREKYINEDIDE